MLPERNLSEKWNLSRKGKENEEFGRKEEIIG